MDSELKLAHYSNPTPPQYESGYESSSYAIVNIFQTQVAEGYYKQLSLSSIT